MRKIRTVIHVYNLDTKETLIFKSGASMRQYYKEKGANFPYDSDHTRYPINETVTKKTIYQITKKEVL